MLQFQILSVETGSVITGSSSHPQQEINFLCPVINLTLQQRAQARLPLYAWEREAEMGDSDLNASFFSVCLRWGLPQHC